MVIASMTKKGSLFSRLFICSCIFYSDQSNLINTIVLYVLYGFAPLCMAPFQCQSSCFSAYWLSISRGHWTRGSLSRDSGLERHRGWSSSDRWTHTFSPVRLTFNLEKWIYVYSPLLLHSHEHTLLCYRRHCHRRHRHRHRHLRTILYKSFQLHPTIWQETPLLFLASSAARELASTFYFQSKIEILQAYLHVRPHTRAQKRHTHRDSLMHAPCGHAFFCLPVSGKKMEIEERSERSGVERRGGEAGRGGLICTDGWSEHMLCSLSLCVWETVITAT